MSSLDQLDPLAPLATQEPLEKRLTREIESLKARAAALERTRAATGVGPYAPEYETLLGGRHYDSVGRRFYVYLGPPRGWVSADAARAQATVTGQVSTASTAWTNLGGPTLTIYVPTPGMIGVQVDSELFSVHSGIADYTDAQVALVQPDGAHQLALNLTQEGRILANPNAAYNAWWRFLSFPSRDTLSLGGAPFPRGGFMLMYVGAGTHTWSLRYRASVYSGAVQPIFFRNRRIWAVAL